MVFQVICVGAPIASTTWESGGDSMESPPLCEGLSHLPTHSCPSSMKAIPKGGDCQPEGAQPNLSAAVESSSRLGKLSGNETSMLQWKLGGYAQKWETSGRYRCVRTKIICRRWPGPNARIPQKWGTGKAEEARGLLAGEPEQENHRIAAGWPSWILHTEDVQV